jgi:plastocyanin
MKLRSGSIKSFLLHTFATITLASVPLIGVLALVSGTASGDSSDVSIRLRDDCDPATFNAANVQCVGNGDTTFQRFGLELMHKQQVDAWRIDPDQTEIEAGQALTVTNRGGETHAFTQVAAFGGGFVAPLNAASGNNTPAPECGFFKDGKLLPAATALASLVPAGTSKPGPMLTPGTHKFQCCIHPWMRTEITQR